MKKGSFCLATFIRIVYMRLIGFCILYFSLVAGSHADECPVQLNPERVIVEFGGSVSADCSTSVQHKGMGWEASEGAVPKSQDSLITWRVSNLTEWDIKPLCYINHKEQCTVTLPVTIYKTPDSVSISTVNHTGPMMEGNQYELQCDVLNVAPVQNLTVNWYKGQTLVDQTIFTDTIHTPVSKTSKLLIRPDRADDGAQYWCEAKLELGEEGPQPPPTAPSKHLNVEVYYKPKHSSSTETININDELTLNCTVKANPSPTYSWQSEHLKETIKSSVLLSSTLSSGNYTCIASNSQGRDSKVFILTSTGPSMEKHIQLLSAVYCRSLLLEEPLDSHSSENSVGRRRLYLSTTDHQPFNRAPFVRSTVFLNTFNMLQYFCGLVYLFAVLLFVTLTGSHAAECPLQLNPERVIVEFGSPVSVDCSTSVQHKGMGWEASEGSVPMSKDSLITWNVSELREWDIEPFCYINYEKQCTVTLPVTIYKTPDSVSISTVNHTGPMMEGNQYELQCDVLNVAPVQTLTVNWYKGQTLVDQTIFTDTIHTPVSKTSKLLIRPDRADDGAQYWCEAKLELGEEGPRPPPTVPSKTLNVEVYYKPKHSSSTETININDELTLNCTVKANPSPTYSWQSEHLKETIKSSVLLSSTLSSGNYTCIASNSQGRDSKVFILTSTDRTTFWPIILSVVAVAVAVVLIVSYVIFKRRASWNAVI
ncbi:hemicentin-1-like [Rhinichthys klamathensis goyatoka]|uniref:hemicentin-1-like n=1 Tax=Rhinichthys klamathensis goyatoka TaxID=3034132 RepID=UPI0024B5206A|nr:hemicentin-1-like [Rhinichthys klamathensis goyatoka]